MKVNINAASFGYAREPHRRSCKYTLLGCIQSTYAHIRGLDQFEFLRITVFLRDRTLVRRI